MLNDRFVRISDIVPDVIQEIRYYSTFNFVGCRIDGYEEPAALLTVDAAEALLRVNEKAKALGCRLKIFDAYRPADAVRHFVRWAADPDDQKMKAWFYPDIDKSLLLEQGYIAERSGHSRGSTVDLTLFDCVEGRDADMGSPFDLFSERSHPDYREKLTDTQYANRMLLRDLMLSCGFAPITTEWWHFCLEKEPYPDTYFNFPSGPDPKLKPWHIADKPVRPVLITR